eukprot:jgi/Botrbrau1/22848/Bobra.0065s0007.1
MVKVIGGPDRRGPDRSKTGLKEAVLQFGSKAYSFVQFAAIAVALPFLISGTSYIYLASELYNCFH